VTDEITWLFGKELTMTRNCKLSMAISVACLTMGTACFFHESASTAHPFSPLAARALRLSLGRSDETNLIDAEGACGLQTFTKGCGIDCIDQTDDSDCCYCAPVADRWSIVPTEYEDEYENILHASQTWTTIPCYNAYQYKGTCLDEECHAVKQNMKCKDSVPKYILQQDPGGT
jgi:hypothetical protein